MTWQEESDCVGSIFRPTYHFLMLLVQAEEARVAAEAKAKANEKKAIVDKLNSARNNLGINPSKPRGTYVERCRSRPL